jgi:hypothetical protein
MFVLPNTPSKKASHGSSMSHGLNIAKNYFQMHGVDDKYGKERAAHGAGITFCRWPP